MTTVDLILRRLATLIFLLLIGTTAFAQSATELAAELQAQLQKGAAVRLKFTVPGDGAYSILVDTHGRRVRLVSRSATIVTDGATVWNYNQAQKRLTMDAISNSPNSAMKSPDELVRFADSYTAEELASRGSTHVIKFVPNAKVKQMLASLGSVESITLTLLKGKHGLSIKHAEIATANANTRVTGVSVQSVSKVGAKDFIFDPPKGAEVIDLRE